MKISAHRFEELKAGRAPRGPTELEQFQRLLAWERRSNAAKKAVETKRRKYTEWPSRSKTHKPKSDLKFELAVNLQVELIHIPDKKHRALSAPQPAWHIVQVSVVSPHSKGKLIIKEWRYDNIIGDNTLTESDRLNKLHAEQVFEELKSKLGV